MKAARVPGPPFFAGFIVPQHVIRQPGKCNNREIDGAIVSCEEDRSLVHDPENLCTFKDV
jgi:hypothetical protein